MATALERVIRLNIAGVSDDAIRKKHADIARAGLAAYLASISPQAPAVRRFIDGREGAVEESVRVPGVIRYEFSMLREIVLAALAMLQERSPVDSGRYKKSWFVMQNGQAIALDAVPQFGEVVITNERSYHRKIETGAMAMSVPPRIVESTRQVMQRKFGHLVFVETRYIDLSGPYRITQRHDPAALPYRLKRDGGRAGRRIGDDISYPALAIRTP